jgi:hypothetical protein
MPLRSKLHLIVFRSTRGPRLWAQEDGDELCAFAKGDSMAEPRARAAKELRHQFRSRLIAPPARKVHSPSTIAAPETKPLRQPSSATGGEMRFGLQLVGFVTDRRALEPPFADNRGAVLCRARLRPQYRSSGRAEVYLCCKYYVNT